ncbi:hypothetical protein [Pseudonocardia sp. T1-2H]|uniref:hypothetical protein n=1 Tax=Pseudonocardia sp. T1-2H TaxID=3128899 RepID=UPI0031011617
MTQPRSGHPPAFPAENPTDPSMPQVARDEAGAVGQTAADAGRQVAETAADQAAQVAEEARRQAGDLFAQAREQAVEQARNGQHKASESLRSLASELHQMAEGGDRSGPAADLAEQAAKRVDEAARWLDNREPGDLVEEFRGLARRRPGAFLLGAAAAGLLVGRLTRGAIDANRDTGSSGYPEPPGPVRAPRPGPAVVPPPPPMPPPMPYDDPRGGALPPAGPLDPPVAPPVSRPVAPPVVPPVPRTRCPRSRPAPCPRARSGRSPGSRPSRGDRPRTPRATRRPPSVSMSRSSSAGQDPSSRTRVIGDDRADASLRRSCGRPGPARRSTRGSRGGRRLGG